MTSVGVAAESVGAEYRAQTRPEMLQFLPAMPAGAKILEVGCGEGHFSRVLRPDHEVWGIEPFAASSEAARHNLDHVFCGTFDEMRAELPHGYFDVVICNDVIEHMTDHDAFLHDVQAVMKPQAWLVASLPNVRYFENLFDLLVLGNWEYQNSGILDRTHLRFFTRRSLQSALTRAGFTVEQMQGINGGIRFGLGRRDLLSYVFAQMLRLIGLGRFEDIRFLQFAVRARRLPG